MQSDNYQGKDCIRAGLAAICAVNVLGGMAYLDCLQLRHCRIRRIFAGVVLAAVNLGAARCSLCSWVLALLLVL